MKKLLLIIFVLISYPVSVSSQSCLPEGIIFETQAQIDSFQILHPNCTEIEGGVEINGDDITNLNGLNVLTSIGGYLEISVNDVLASLTGLENVTSIGEHFVISENGALTSLTGLENVTSIGGLGIAHNYALTSLTGLENVTSIGGNLAIWNNDALTSLTGLENVTSIGGNLWIIYNAVLTSLTGLENIEAESIKDLEIEYNPYLSHCSVLSICNYLSNPNGTIDITNNTSGCDSPDEVQDSCYWVSVDEQYINDNLVLFPNPANQELNISADGYAIEEVAIYTLTGQKVLQERPEGGAIDISNLQPGMYIIVVTIENMKVRQKLLVQR